MFFLIDSYACVSVVVLLSKERLKNKEIGKHRPCLDSYMLPFRMTFAYLGMSNQRKTTKDKEETHHVPSTSSQEPYHTYFLTSPILSIASSLVR